MQQVLFIIFIGANHFVSEICGITTNQHNTHSVSFVPPHEDDHFDHFHEHGTVVFPPELLQSRAKLYPLSNRTDISRINGTASGIIKFVGNSTKRQNDLNVTSSASSSALTLTGCICGISKLEFGKRITGGVLSEENKWPWMGALVYMGTRGLFWFCGVSLINDRYVLTAAHCLNSLRRYGVNNVRVFLGTNDILSGPNSLILEIESTLGHPQYGPSTEDFDVALIKLKEKVVFTDEILPICLTQRGAPFTGRLATVAGWGSTAYGKSPPESLREVEVKVVTNQICSRVYYYHYRAPITNNMLCAWLPGKDSCQGDSGGPLFLKTIDAPFVYTQIGIVSFGPPSCGTSNIPGVYSRITSVVDWIKENTQDANYCPASF